MRSTWPGMALTLQEPRCMKFAWSAGGRHHRERETLDTRLSILRREFTSLRAKSNGVDNVRS